MGADQATVAPPSAARYREAMARSASVRRFFERWMADSQFRSRFSIDPAAALEDAGLRVDAEELASLRGPTNGGHSPGVRRMWEEAAAKDRWVREFYWTYAVPLDPRIQRWRERQVARQRLDLGPHFADANIHSSLAIELTKGCTGGCWFCAIGAGTFEGHWPYTEPNAALWRGMLDALRARLGPAAASGFLYWATDPLDNPDYERFCLDFYEGIGVFPPTTTALALRDVPRTKALLALAESHECWLNRFSVLSLRAMDQIRSAFTEDELALVECLPLNRGAAFAYGNAGRFRDHALRSPSLLEEQRHKLQSATWWASDEGYRASKDYPNNSIGCVSGFLVNAVARTVQLISPCSADDRWPLGYHVYDEAHYDSLEEFEACLDRIIALQMPLAVADDAWPRLNPWLGYEDSREGCQLTGRFGTRVALTDTNAPDALRSLVSRLWAGTQTTAQLKGLLQREHAVSGRWVQQHLDGLLRAGALDESPPC
jgi:radical SAM family RiPP maturation amino acid epimerase